MPEEKIENINKSGSTFAATFFDHYVLPDTNFNGHFLINNNISITKKVINLYMPYILSPWLRILNTDFTLENCLFRSVKLTKNADSRKYKYSCYGTGFDSRSEFSYTDGIVEKKSLLLELI